ncbi:MAG: acyl carrier protein [Alphaproteobacteria bacterium]|nr:acyl carrier protein [Alphaproteobacteria bacterium]
MSDALARARNLLAGALEIDPAAIADDASIDTLEQWDSLAHMRVVLAIEAARGHELDPELMFMIGSLHDIANVLGDPKT